MKQTSGKFDAKNKEVWRIAWPGSVPLKMTDSRQTDSKQFSVRQVTLSALGIAIVCIGTMVIQIPIPLGYMHLGNCCILLMGVFLGKTVGTLSGGIGSALSDMLSGYPQWILPTLIIKGIMGFAVAAIAQKKGGEAHMASLRTFAAVVAGILIMIAGYTVAGGVLYGSMAFGLAQVPGLTLEGVIGIVLFYAAGFAFEAARIPGRLKGIL